MKRNLPVILLVVFMLVLVSCANETPDTSSADQTPSAEESVDDTSNQQSYKTENATKDNVAEFMQALGEAYAASDEEQCYNITPGSIAEETSAQIFKFSDSCASFIYLDGEVYPLGEWFGGYGFVNAVVCDLDLDDNKDILYTYSWGSGIHRSLVAVFNTQTKESTIIYDTLDTDDPQVDLYIVEDTNLDRYMIYVGAVGVVDNDFINLEFLPDRIIGTVESVDGDAVFFPG